MKKRIFALLLVMISLSQAAVFHSKPTWNYARVRESKVETTLHYDGENSSGIGTYGASVFEAAIRLTPTELAASYGKKIKKVQLYIVGNTFTAVTLKIYEGATATQPGVLRGSQLLNVVPDALTTYELLSPVLLENGKDYWVGYEIATTGGQPGGVDAGPVAAPGKSNLMKYNGSWTTISALSPDMVNNWNIRAIVDDAGPDIQAPTVVSVAGTNNIPAAPLNISLTVFDQTGIPATLAGKYNIGAGDVDITLTRSTNKLDYNYTGSIPGQADGVNGTLKFNLIDNLGNQQWSENFPISWSVPPNYVLNENFDGVTAPALPAGWTFEDANNDGLQWRTSSGGQSAPNALMMEYSPDIDMNDWVYTPGFNPIPNTPYKLKFSYKAESSEFPEKLEVKYGTAAAAAGMTNSLLAPTEVANSIYQTDSISFTPTTSDKIYIGFHGMSTAFQWNLYLDDIKIIGDLATDVTFPEVATPTGTTAFLNNPMTISTVLTDATGVASIVGHYKLAGESAWTDFPMTATRFIGNYSGTIPAQANPVTGVVKFTSTDTASPANSGDSPETVISWSIEPSVKWMEWGTEYETGSGVGMAAAPWWCATDFDFGTGGSWRITKVKLGVSTPVSVPWSVKSAVQTNATTLTLGNNIISGTIDCNGYSDIVPAIAAVTDTTVIQSGHIGLVFDMPAASYVTLDRQAGNNHTYVSSTGGTTMQTLNSLASQFNGAWLAGLYVSKDPVGIQGVEMLPGRTELSQNYPNPFNPVTSIKFFNNMTGKVKLTVLNAKGETVAVLLNGNISAGNHMVNFNGAGYNSGVYFYKLETPTATITKKMLMIK